MSAAPTARTAATAQAQAAHAQAQAAQAPRTLAVWCPDWPVTAAARALPPRDVDGAPMAVLSANRVVACSHSARRAGVSRGLRRREAQARCPELVVLHRDELAEARLFEPVVAAVESLAPGVEVSRPGLAAVGARGPSRYLGGEDAVVGALAREVGTHVPDAMIGIADGPFAAEQAARRGVIVPPGQSGDFLADLPVETLGDPDLADLLRRLGIRRLSQFAQLPARDVLARFGPAGAWAHRQAQGRDARPLAARAPGVDFAVRLDFEPPLTRVDTVAFSARTLVEDFIATLAGHGLACTCLELTLQTDNGEEAVRRWRHTGVLGAPDVLDRIRWQVEGWLHGRRGARDSAVQGSAVQGSDVPPPPTAGITLLRLAPIETVPTGAHQQALWGGSGAQDERAHRALARVQTLLGHGSVLTAVVNGGRDPLQRTQLIAWGDERAPAQSPDEPWPGRLPSPAPTVLLDPPAPARVVDEAGRPVAVTARGAVPMPPARLCVEGGAFVAVTAWAGPWPVEEQWWHGLAGPGPSRAEPGTLPPRRFRFQLVDLRGRAYLALCAPGPDPAAPLWSIEGIYD